MTTAAPSTALATIQPAFTDSERLALAGYLAGYRGLTREAYALDLRQFTTWCRARSLSLLAVRRPEIESFARDLEARGRARATVTRRLSTIAGFYKYAVGLDRNEVGALLVAAGLGPPTEHALISLLALNGLRVSEATGADIEHLGLERGHRTLTITRKGGKVVTIHARAAHGPGNRPGHRRAHRRVGIPDRGRAAAGPARRRADRPQDRPPRRDRQSCHTPHAAARVHHRRPGCRGAAARRSRSLVTCRPANDDAV
jgi:integrase